MVREAPSPEWRNVFADGGIACASALQAAQTPYDLRSLCNALRRPPAIRATYVTGRAGALPFAQLMETAAQAHWH